MVETAKANGVNPYYYLQYLLEKYPSKLMSDEELEAMAPWNEAVKAEVERLSASADQEADPKW